jgi:hypothetical protein
VAAHALISGKVGNIPAYTINQVVGSSIYIRNLSAFSGGHDSYTVQYVTAQDKPAALASAREQLAIVAVGLHYPCLESSLRTSLTWRCQMLTYHIPAFYHVTGVRIIGKNLLIDVWFVARPNYRWTR